MLAHAPIHRNITPPHGSAIVIDFFDQLVRGDRRWQSGDFFRQSLPLRQGNRRITGIGPFFPQVRRPVHCEFGFEIEIYKKIKAGSGIGSSAASAAGAVFGVNELLGKPFSKKELVQFAMKGEAIASGSEHADNVAPAIFGGITLIRSTKPLDVIKIESPSELYATVIHPQIELKTSDMRAVLKPEVSLKSAIIQWGNLGGLISGFYTSDYELIGRSLHDEIVEPLRGQFIPKFDLIKRMALENGALGSGISGSGPSIFALSKGVETANRIANTIGDVYKEMNLPYDIHVSKVNSEGIKIL